MNELAVKPTGQLVTGARLQIQNCSITELVSGAKQIGAMLYNARRFGFNSQQDAESHALICLMTGGDPMAVIAETDNWQFIAGNRQMKYRAMANRFLLTGGIIEPITRTPLKAEASLRRNGVTLQTSFTWAEAQKEPYVWVKEAECNKGKVPCFIDGKPNEKALKDNWSTPRRRMQMLWARMITDAISSTWADVIGGAYVVSEINDDDEEEQMLEGEVVVKQLPPAQEPAPAPLMLSHQPVAEPVVEPVTEAAVEPAVEEEIPERPDPFGPISVDMVQKLKTLREELALPTDTWKQLLANFGVASGIDLTQEQAEQLESTMLQRLEIKKLEDDAKTFLSEPASAGQTP